MAADLGPWADKPFPLVTTEGWKSTNPADSAVVHMSIEMVRAHNTILRGLNAVYQQGAYVKKPEDIADYLFFCKAWTMITNHHHDAEEQVLFPELIEITGKKDLMNANLLQHKAFHDGLGEFEVYVENTKPEDYSWDKLKSLIDAFAPALVAHLEEEIPTIFALKEYDDAKLRAAWAKMAKFATSMGGPASTEVVIPCAIGCIDRGYEGGLHKNFPPFPFFVPYIVDWVYARKHRGAWRFLPCDFYRNPRPLAFTANTVEA